MLGSRPEKNEPLRLLWHYSGVPRSPNLGASGVIFIQAQSRENALGSGFHQKNFRAPEERLQGLRFSTGPEFNVVLFVILYN